ncbi:MAG: hypothetical protein K9L56_14195 [Clostridiales bacterium]|nr:hypothetical protein [Clostridiales bacterium]
MSYDGHTITQLENAVITAVNNYADIDYLGADCESLGLKFYQKPLNLVDSLPFIYVDNTGFKNNISQKYSDGRVQAHSENHNVLVYLGSDRKETAVTDIGIDTMLKDITDCLNGNQVGFLDTQGCDFRSAQEFAKFPVNSSTVEKMVIWETVFDIKLLRTD